jgi:hypothetical protein
MKKRRKMMRRVFVALISALASILAIAVLSGCNSSKTSADVSQPKDEIKASQNGDVISGKVVETMDSGGYTYVCVEKNSKKSWVAIPGTKVTVGEEMAFHPQMEMSNFKSKTLNRTFETIYFSAGAIGHQETVVSVQTMAPKNAPAVSAEEIHVAKAAGPDAYTVAELFGKRNDLDKKKVTVKGKVVKVSAGIMGVNWIHIRDGSGDAKKGTNDLVVTSQELASVGDIVTASGTLAKDKDFGAGYRYDVIVEAASIKK